MMNAVRSLVTTGLLLSSFALGCAEADSLGDIDEPGAEPQEGGNTSGGSNGAPVVPYWFGETPLIESTERSLVNPGTTTVNTTTQSDLNATALHPDVFKYAVKCGLKKNRTAYWSGGNFSGMGHLSTTSGWAAGALSTSAANDLLGCVVALLNPLGLTVPIGLSGPSVAEDGVDQSEYVVEEALWLVEGTAARTYTVWPRQPFSSRCGIDAYEALKVRVCGQDPTDCALQLGVETDCSFTENVGYHCKGKPALLTVLKESDVATLHPGCNPAGP